VILSASAFAAAQVTVSGPSEDVEQVTAEAQSTPDRPLLTLDRPLYRALQQSKRTLEARLGLTFALEDTLIYQTATGGIEPRDGMVNTLGLFATWKIFRDPDGKDFAGLGFQAQVRGNHRNPFPALRQDLGSIWSPNDSTSDDYSRINQLWWGQRLGDARFTYLLGKIDPGSRLNTNRFAGSGNTQFFGQPYATNPARSFPDSGLGLFARADLTDALYLQGTISDGDAISTHSPFTSVNGRWLYAGEVGFTPIIPGLGQGMYRFMLYQREIESADEVGWALSFDQNLTDRFGVFLRYGGNDGGINAIEHLVSAGFSFLQPLDRINDQAGIAVSYTHPSDDNARDEYAAEVYYRLQLSEGLELSASTQFIHDPSAGDETNIAIFGLRARVLY
jgi:hypothetical protein